MNKVEIFENERASGYNTFVETWIPNYSVFLNDLPKLFSKMNPKELLVVGCGTGNEIEQFVHRSERWLITGIDPSPEMVKQAIDRFQGYEHVTLMEGLVTAIDAEKKYSAATLLLVLHFLEDDGNKLNLLSNIAERLVSGATFVMLDITGDKQQIKQNLKILRLLLPDGLDEQQINHRLNRIENELFPISEERLAALCVTAGFEKPIRFFQSSIYMGWLMTKK
ncbi:class I SAM-dependent methyltransferase [Olivibacter ginsenosidimutans]|uniref:Class I SAM-dependent methyltransferase n=1 Tax=Olivibacter ginsenosidimutans TaxID=1176537 RepID=A0ABP9CEN6_9SPHI